MKKSFFFFVMLGCLSCSKQDLSQQLGSKNDPATRSKNGLESGVTALANTRYIGTTLGFGKVIRAGGLPAVTADGNIIYNLPLYKAQSTENDWWDNLVEEVAYSGIDYVVPVDRGYSPRVDVDFGDPRRLKNLVAAMDRRGLSNAFKIGVFVDCPSAFTANRNVDQGLGYKGTPLFDCADTANYKYVWDYNIKTAFDNVPDAKRFKINGKPVIIFWAVGPTWDVNCGNGSLKKILLYLRSKCQSVFGFSPYIVVDRTWINNDPATKDPAVIDAVNNWFSIDTPYSNAIFNGVNTAALIPGFRVVNNARNMFVDPQHGQTFTNNLTLTKAAGASLTLIEGFTDCAENTAIFRSKDKVYYDYPNQRINILRRFTSNPYPAVLKVEAEGCDFYSDLTPGNAGNVYRDGDLDIAVSTDVNGGWCVTDAQTREWLEWKELPLLAHSRFQLRYSSTAAAAVQFIIDGVALPAVNLPASGAGKWLTQNAGDYTTTANGLHTVQIRVVAGALSMNYFNRVAQ